MGFLNEPSLDNTHQITPDGSFRILIEMWMLAYFGKTLF